MTLVVMGPSACGKSTIGRLTAKKAGVPFFEGDDYHPPENIEKMRRGEGLTNEERWPWIDAIGEAVRACHAPRAVLACSALNQEVRARLKRVLPGPARFLMLQVPKEVLLARLQRRQNHFAGPELLESQLRAMDEGRGVRRISAAAPPKILAKRLAEMLAPKA